MAKNTNIFVLVLIVTLTLASSAYAVDKKKEVQFDFWTFSLYWAPAVCHHTTACCNTNACCSADAPIKFVIEGLWPDYNNGTYPSFCKCSSDRFKLKRVAPLIPSLEAEWPFLSCNSSTICGNRTSQSVWATQWEKHGACSNMDEYNYFLKALRLYNDFQILDVFSNSGFNPSNSAAYRFADVVNKIKKALGAAPTIVCDNNKIKAVRICISKDFSKVQDCDHTGFVCPKYVKVATYGPLGDTSTIEGHIAEVTW